MSPAGTSRSAPSTSLATSGIAETLSGTIAAVVPMKVPRSSMVNGMIATRRITNGTDLPRFTMAESAWLSHLCSKICPGLVVKRRTPRGMPKSAPKNPEANVM